MDKTLLDGSHVFEHIANIPDAGYFSKDFKMNKVINPDTGLTVAHILVNKDWAGYLKLMSIDDMCIAMKDGSTVGARGFNAAKATTDIRHDWWGMTTKGTYILKEICKRAPALTSYLDIGIPTEEKVKAIDNIKIRFPEIYNKMRIKLSMESPQEDNETSNAPSI
jgi:hypothetical protein